MKNIQLGKNLRPKQGEKSPCCRASVRILKDRHICVLCSKEVKPKTLQ